MFFKAIIIIAVVSMTGIMIKNKIKNDKYKRKASLKPTARMVMRRETQAFTDLLEPLYSISQGQLSHEEALAVFEQWETRIKAMEDVDKLAEKWEMVTNGYRTARIEELNNTAFRWLNQIKSFGISRDSRNAVQVTETIKQAYIGNDETSLNIGDLMLVKTAAWFLDADVICQGILAKETGDATSKL